MSISSFDIFVPGRVCLFGEHSDWAGAFRRFNPRILPGQVIITGTNQGIFAKVRPLPDVFKLKSTLPDGTVTQTLNDEQAAAAQKLRWWEYYRLKNGLDAD